MELLLAKIQQMGDIADKDNFINSLGLNDSILVEVDGCMKRIKKKNFLNIPEAKLRIIASPSDATITLNGVVQDEITVVEGSYVSVKVEKDHYTPYQDNIQVNEDITEEIELDEITYTLTVSPSPSDAVVKINNQITSTLSNISHGTTVAIEVSKAGYITSSSSVTVTADAVIPITLQTVPVQNYTLIVNPTPSDSVVTLNGQNVSALSVASGTDVIISVSKSGYVTHTETVTVTSNITKNITLQAIPQPVGFPYYWGEIGNIFAPDPSDITESNWDTHIKHNGTNGGMLYFPNATSFPNDMWKESTGLNYQWWIVLIPHSQTSIVNDLPNYGWFVWDELLQAWVDFVAETEETTSIGDLTLDGVFYTYNAIRPTVITKVKFSKTQISGQP